MVRAAEAPLQITADDLAAVLATCHLPRRRGRGIESDQVAATRGRLNAVIAGLLFMGGLRRSEVSALRWADVEDAGDADGILVTVRSRRWRWDCGLRPRPGPPASSAA